MPAIIKPEADTPPLLLFDEPSLVNSRPKRVGQDLWTLLDRPA